MSTNLTVACPECDAEITFPVELTLKTLDGRQYVHADPDLSDVWLHSWTHTDGSRP